MITRFTDSTGIVISCQEVYSPRERRNIKRWGHYDTNQAGRIAHVGPWYHSKAELLADHESYLKRAGWLGGAQ